MSNKRPNKEAMVRVPETLRRVKNIIGVFSAKGGVGKSEVSLNLALSLADKGYAVGLLDADIYGPSQPVLLKASSEEIDVKDNKLLIPLNKKGIKFVSMGLIARGQKPVIWRGPMVSGAVMQLMSQTDWQELDYLIIDTPPGTGDVQLTLLQRLPLNGALVVTTPQEVSTSDTRKGIEMIKRLELPILGLVENMSFFQPSDSKKKYFIFGKGGGQNLAKEYGLDLLSEIPLLEKKEFVILYELSDYKLIFDSIAKKVIKNMEIIKKSVSQIIPQKKV
ncbi:MAG: Mrp/NBP35 family ATP-binding protein [SAR86 cluster bacterium]|mgnify:FL=1|jgi:ATP-binding protein involved in chromosome partitioning|tara:strand:+ start:126 stop:956 length:831 start_codon:yes stop_codon:yes gene_type:complete